MNLETWAKTIFSVYRYLPKLADSIDKIFEMKAIFSNNISGANFSTNNTLNIASSLLELTERKKALINLKVLAHKIFKNIDKMEAKTLILRFIDNFAIERIADMLNISSRTVYRKINDGLKSSALFLHTNGFDIPKLEELTQSEKWIRDLCLENEKRGEGVTITTERFRAIYNSYKKVGVELQSSIS